MRRKGAEEATLGRKLSYSWNNAMDFARLVRLSLQMLVTGQAGVKDLSGPVGIVSTMTQVGEQAATTRAAVENIAYLAALIGIKLTGMRMRAPAANGAPYPHPLSAPRVRRKAAAAASTKGPKA